MKFSTVATGAAAIAGVSAAYSNVTTITSEVVVTSQTVVSEYTTYCPLATSWVENNSTIVVTAPATITVTNCPCTRTATYTTTTVTVFPVSSAAASKNATVAPVQPTVTSTQVQQGNGAQFGISALVGGVALAAAFL